MPVSPQQNSGGSEPTHPSSLLPNHPYGPFPRPNDIRRREHLERYHPIVAGSLIESWLESPEPVHSFPQTPKRREISFLRPNDIRRINHVQGHHPVVPKAPPQRAETSPLKLQHGTLIGNSKTSPWLIQWKLNHESKSGGWIVQHIQANFTGAGNFDYWEAWQVPAHSRSTKTLIVFGYDDMFRGLTGSHIHSSARFYDGLQLPASFTVHPAGFPAGVLRATTVDPHLPLKHATAADNRDWTSP